ncbi:uncharacterized protein TNCV_1295351 [Trichonephila clavipes]|nr:uncharacterized protein TNCV_1295351 [Trichonephila clavipes]
MFAFYNHLLIKSVGPKVLWTLVAETASAGDWRILPSPLVPCLNCGGGDQWCRHLSEASPTCLTGFGYIYSFPLGISPSQIVLSPVWCSRLRPTTVAGNRHRVLLSAMQKLPSHEDHHKPRLPDPIATANSLHATPQNVNCNERQAPYRRL